MYLSYKKMHDNYTSEYHGKRWYPVTGFTT